MAFSSGTGGVLGTYRALVVVPFGNCVPPGGGAVREFESVRAGAVEHLGSASVRGFGGAPEGGDGPQGRVVGVDDRALGGGACGGQEWGAVGQYDHVARQ